MDKQEIINKLQELQQEWDDDNCIDWAYTAIETIEQILKDRSIDTHCPEA